MSRSIGENSKKKLFYLFSNYLLSQIWTLKIYNHDISKTITARSFKLDQLIEDDEKINWSESKNKKKDIIFIFKSSPFADFGFEIL